MNEDLIEKEHLARLEKIPFDDNGFKKDLTGKIVQFQIPKDYDKYNFDELELIKEFFVNHLHHHYKEIRIAENNNDNDTYSKILMKIGETELEYKKVMILYYDKLRKENENK